jgi:drug/metabolite transporter (DMT)-like permease
VGQEAGTSRRRQGLVLGLIVVGVLLSLTNTNAQSELVRRREDTCDGSLALPTGAYVLGFTGLAVGSVALVLLVRWFGGSREPIALILFATAIAAVVVEIFAVVTAFQEGQPVYPMCGG